MIEFSFGEMEEVVEPMAYMYDGNWGKYRVLQSKIGEGGFASVDLVSGLCSLDRADGSPPREKRYAAKILSPEKLIAVGSERAELIWEHFREEILSLHELFTTEGMNHPHIISVPDYGLPEHYKMGHSFGIMELAESDLAEQIEYEKQSVVRRLLGRASGRSTWTVAEKLRQFAGLASALDMLHSMDVVHRDLKPENLLIVESKLLLSDLGLAAEKSGHGVERAGTPRYSAPEFFQRFYRGSVHPASDVFSWAVVLYEFLSGNYPFEALDFDTTISRIQEKLYSSLSSVSISGADKELRKTLDGEIFGKCFSPSPEMRPSAKEVEEALLAILEDRGWSS